MRKSVVLAIIVYIILLTVLWNPFAQYIALSDWILLPVQGVAYLNLLGPAVAITIVGAILSLSTMIISNRIEEEEE